MDSISNVSGVVVHWGRDAKERDLDVTRSLDLCDVCSFFRSSKEDYGVVCVLCSCTTRKCIKKHLNANYFVCCMYGQCKTNAAL